MHDKLGGDYYGKRFNKLVTINDVLLLSGILLKLGAHVLTIGRLISFIYFINNL